GAVTVVSYVMKAPQSWPMRSTWRWGDHWSISATTSLVKDAKSNGPAVGDVATLAAEFGEERLRRWRVVRESVQEDRWLTCGVTALQSVKSAVRQVESDVFEVHACCACFEVGGRGVV